MFQKTSGYKIFLTHTVHCMIKVNAVMKRRPFYTKVVQATGCGQLQTQKPRTT